MGLPVIKAVPAGLVVTQTELAGLDMTGMVPAQT
jgi:hypothetical protein